MATQWRHMRYNVYRVGVCVSLLLFQWDFIIAILVNNSVFHSSRVRKAYLNAGKPNIYVLFCDLSHLSIFESFILIAFYNSNSILVYCGVKINNDFPLLWICMNKMSHTTGIKASTDVFLVVFVRIIITNFVTIDRYNNY